MSDFYTYDMMDNSGSGSSSGGGIIGSGSSSNNVSLTLADHLWVSREAQAILGGVVGFWGGVFGMGLVYLFIVFLRRFRKDCSGSVKGSIDHKSWSGMFGTAQPVNHQMDEGHQQHQQQHHVSVTRQHHRSQRTKTFGRSAYSFGHSGSAGSGFGGSGGGTRLKFSGFGLGSNRDDSGMADCQL